MHKNPEERRAYMRAYRKQWLANPKNRIRVNRLRRRRQNINREEYLRDRRSYYRRNSSRIRKRENAKRLAIKREVFAAYGGKCSCCGEAEECFLTIDHIHGRGRSHRKMNNMEGFKLYLWLRRNGCPTDNFRLLCQNCNVGTYRNNGVCPHKAK